MSARRIADLQREIRELKRTTVRYRAGTIADTSPLAVDLGASGVPTPDVRSLTTDLDIGDQVAVLVFGNDLLVLGRILS